MVLNYSKFSRCLNIETQVIQSGLLTVSGIFFTEHNLPEDICTLVNLNPDMFALE